MNRVAQDNKLICEPTLLQSFASAEICKQSAEMMQLPAYQLGLVLLTSGSMP